MSFKAYPTRLNIIYALLATTHFLLLTIGSRTSFGESNCRDSLGTSRHDANVVSLVGYCEARCWGRPGRYYDTLKGASRAKSSIACSCTLHSPTKGMLLMTNFRLDQRKLCFCPATRHRPNACSIKLSDGLVSAEHTRREIKGRQQILVRATSACLRTQHAGT